MKLVFVVLASVLAAASGFNHAVELLTPKNHVVHNLALKEVNLKPSFLIFLATKSEFHNQTLISDTRGR